jgi:tetratricopeptide (TPR) repeat protein
MDATLGGPTVSSGGVSLSSRRDTDPYRREGVGSDLGSGRVDLSGCLCEASLAGYQSQPISLGIRSVFDSSEIGKLTLYPIGEKNGTTISLISLNAPKKAKDSCRKAEKEIAKQKVNYSKVAKHLTKATDIYPQYAEAWQLLGEVQLLQGDEANARECFQQALTADPQFVTPHLVLGELEIHAHDWQKAADHMGRAIELDPNLIQANYFYALSKYYLHQDAEAETAILKVQESQAAQLFPASHYLLGGIHEDRGHFQAAAMEFRRFLETNPPEDLASEVESKIEIWVSQGLVPTESEVVDGN